MKNLRWVAGFSLAVCGASSACGGSAPATAKTAYAADVEAKPDGASVPAVHKRGEQKLIVLVGPLGGSLELDNGGRLVIPQGALNEPVEVTFAVGARTTAFSNHDYEKAIGPTLEIALDSALQKPLEISIPDTKLPEGFAEKDLSMAVEVPASTQRAVQGQGVQTRWDYLTASAKAGRAVAELAEVPGYRVQFLVSKSD